MVSGIQSSIISALKKIHAGENVIVPRIAAFQDWLLAQAQYSPARGPKQALENNTWLKRL